MTCKVTVGLQAYGVRINAVTYALLKEENLCFKQQHGEFLEFTQKSLTQIELLPVGHMLPLACENYVKQ